MQDACVEALMQADEGNLVQLSWLHDLPQRLVQHRQRQQHLHGSQQDVAKSGAEKPEAAEGSEEDAADEQGAGSEEAETQVCQICLIKVVLCSFATKTMQLALRHSCLTQRGEPCSVRCVLEGL